jgi:hypothetical protein
MPPTPDRVGDWIQTFTGKKFWPLDPRPEEIDIKDIAHALSLICRFGGHCREFYSVAQHSILVAQYCAVPDAMWGLLHDAAEAYLCDLPRPIKRSLRELSGGESWYDRIESKLMEAVCTRFNLDPIQPASVSKADMLLLGTEARDLMQISVNNWIEGMEVLPFRITPYPAELAEECFLSLFHCLEERGNNAIDPG